VRFAWFLPFVNEFLLLKSWRKFFRSQVSAELDTTEQHFTQSHDKQTLNVFPSRLFSLKSAHLVIGQCFEENEWVSNEEFKKAGKKKI
jgi:hypothetical protein